LQKYLTKDLLVASKWQNSNPSSPDQLSLAVEWRARVTQAALGWEQVWPRLWPALGFFGVFAILSLWDIWLKVPGTVHLASLVFVVSASLVSLIQNFKGIHWPTRQMALRRLETDNHLPHRPLTSFDDVPALNTEDPTVKSLWQQKKQLAKEAMQSIGLHRPKSGLPRRDPMALRAALIIIAIPSFWAAGSEWSERLVHAFKPTLSARAASTAQIEAWIDPPSYTHVAPIYLTSESPVPKDKVIEIPENSILVARSSETLGSLSFKSSSRLVETPKGAPVNDTANTLKHAIRSDQSVSLRQNSREVATWKFKVRPDRPPAIAIAGDITSTVRNTLELAYAIRDDYGVVEAVAQIKLEGTDEVSEILKVPLALPSVKPSKVDETAYHDLTSHPWAGLPVRVELVAMDEIGQLGRSGAQMLMLPERSFFHPVAKAIIEQRRNLGQDPNSWEDVVLALDALAILSGDLATDYTLFLGLRSARWSLVSRKPTRMAQIDDVYGLLWDLALRLEDGDVAEAEQNLRSVQQALMDALARDASQNELEKLFKDYAAALQNYLQALSEQALADGQDPSQTQPSPQATTQLGAQDLEDLLRSVQDLAATGDQQAARQMLAELQRLLENMVAGAPTPMSPEQAQMTQSIDQLTDMMNKQRALLDETFAQSSGNSAAPQIEEAPLGGVGQSQNAGPSPQPATPLQNLAPDQESLGRELADLLESLQGQSPGAEGLSDLQSAQASMQGAADALSGDRGPVAQQNQRQAIEDLSKGANSLAQTLMSQMTAQGRPGPGQNPDTDPLGRTPGTANSLGDHITVPGERDLQRAREILQELQRRASEQGRPAIELEYLERLLKRF
jgi:uncharacterized protein (TIGR02302 family)